MLPQESPHVFRTQTITPYDHWFAELSTSMYSEARAEGSGEAASDVLQMLSRVDPRIVGLEVLAARSELEGIPVPAVLYLRDRDAGLLPVSAFGDGMRRILLIAFGGFLMTCTVGPAAAVVIDVVHPGVRATGAAVLSVFQNLLGLSVGPVLAGALSDSFGLGSALTMVSTLGVLSALLMARAARSYEADMQRYAAVHVDPEATDAGAARTTAHGEVK